MPSIETVTPSRLAELHRQEPVELLDVRTPVEFREVHATTAHNVPLDTLDPKRFIEQRDCPADTPVYIICKSGARGSKACEKFIEAGFNNVVNVEGGTQAWDAAGLPVVRGKKAISLERQVRMAAGFLAFTGGVLALTVHPYFAGIPTFIGAGLMFAGITDTCGMGMMLAKMPWNQVKDSSASTCST